MGTRSFAMNYGGVLGLFLVLLAIILYVLGVDEKESMLPSILNNIVIILGITYSIIQFRDLQNNGIINYSTSLKLGVSVAFFSSVILTLYTYIFINFIHPEYLNEMLEYTEQAILQTDPDISESDIESALSATKKVFAPQWIIPLGILGGTLMGAIYSLIISFFVKREDNNQLS